MSIITVDFKNSKSILRNRYIKMNNHKRFLVEEIKVRDKYYKWVAEVDLDDRPLVVNTDRIHIEAEAMYRFLDKKEHPESICSDLGATPLEFINWIKKYESAGVYK